MNKIKLSTVRGYLNIVSSSPLTHIWEDDKNVIKLTPNTKYSLEIYPDQNIFAIVRTDGNLEDGQEISVGFHCCDDPEYCSPYILVKIEY